MSGNSSKIAVVTGASRGIGRAVALEFATGAYEVWAIARDGDALQALASEGAGRGLQIRCLTADLARANEVISVCARILEQGTAPSVLVNNAGIGLSAPLHKHTLEDFQTQLAVNTVAPFLFCRELMPAMSKLGRASVINIASTAGMKGFKYTSGYCASKHALVGLTRSLAIEYGQRNVTVNAVCPGWTATDMVSAAAANIASVTGKSDAQAREILAARNPLNRLIAPEEIAKLCAFLASPAAAAVTGATYAIDGGETS